jgi:CheY-like chemotaxis protein
VSGVAHDFNNVLAVIQASAEMARRQRSPAEVDRLLGDVLAAVRAAAELTRPLLGFAGQSEDEPAPVRPAEVVAGLERLLARVVGDRIALELDLAAAAGDAVRIDRTRLEQAVMNLVINANDAMPDGGVIRIRVARQAMDGACGKLVAGEYVVVSVTDSGSGMDPDTAQRAFDPFFTTKGRGQGTGLGLSSCYAAAQQAGGTAWIETAPGAGTTVTLALRRLGTAVMPAVAGEASAARGSGQLVLVVDDEPLVRGAVVAVLEDLGFRAITAERADDALAMVRDGAVAADLVLTDLAMPGIDGLDLAAQLIDRMPVVVMSGHARPEFHAQRPVAARVAWLGKPFTVAQLAETLVVALARRR